MVAGAPDGFKGRVLRNFSALVVVRGLGLIAPLIALPYILRVIGLENYGHVAFSMIVATFAGSIIQYGFPITAVKTVAEANRAGRGLDAAFWNNFHASLTIALVVGAAHLAVVLSLPAFRAMLPVHLGAILMATGIALFPHWLFLGLERSFYVAFSTLLVRLGHLGLIVVFIRDPGDYVLVNYLGAAAAWLNIAIALWLILGRFGLRPTAPAPRRIARVIREVFPAFLLQWSPNLYNSASAILLGFHVPPAVLGGFNAANSLITVVGALGQLLSNAFLPILSTGFDRHRVAATILMAAGVVIALLAWLLAPVAAAVLTDTGREVIAQNIRYLSFSLPFLFAYLAYGHNYVALTEKRILAGRLTAVFSLIGLALAFILIPRIGVAGFAWVLVLSRGGMALMVYILYRQHRRETLDADRRSLNAHE